MWFGKYYMILGGYFDMVQRYCLLLRMNGIEYESIDDNALKSVGIYPYKDGIHIGLIVKEKWQYRFLEQFHRAMYSGYHEADVNHTMFLVRTRKYINGK